MPHNQVSAPTGRAEHEACDLWQVSTWLQNPSAPLSPAVSPASRSRERLTVAGDAGAPGGAGVELTVTILGWQDGHPQPCRPTPQPPQVCGFGSWSCRWLLHPPATGNPASDLCLALSCGISKRLPVLLWCLWVHVTTSLSLTTP